LGKERGRPVLTNTTVHQERGADVLKTSLDRKIHGSTAMYVQRSYGTVQGNVFLLACNKIIYRMPAFGTGVPTIRA
jgi:hypothetical protein